MHKVPKQTPTYGKLVSAIQKNEHWALKQIYKENYPAVEAYILKNHGTHEEAKDVFQESLIVVWQKISNGSFREEKIDGVGGFIYQIARYKWLDKLKSARHRKTTSIETLTVVPREEENFDPAMEEDLRHTEDNEKVAKLFQQMGQKCQTILTRYYFEKLSMKQMAEELGYEPESIRTLKYRCMQKLRRLYKENFDESE